MMTEKNVANSAENPGKMSHRLIDADALWDAVGEIELPRGAYYVAVELQKTFDAAPTVDAVPVVRCKDCQKFGNDEACPMLSMQAYTEEDDYCSIGERKNDNGQWDHPAG